MKNTEASNFLNSKNQSIDQIHLEIEYLDKKISKVSDLGSSEDIMKVKEKLKDSLAKLHATESQRTSLSRITKSRITDLISDIDVYQRGDTSVDFDSQSKAIGDILAGFPNPNELNTTQFASLYEQLNDLDIATMTKGDLGFDQKDENILAQYIEKLESMDISSLSFTEKNLYQRLLAKLFELKDDSLYQANHLFMDDRDDTVGMNKDFIIDALDIEPGQFLEIEYYFRKYIDFKYTNIEEFVLLIKPIINLLLETPEYFKLFLKTASNNYRSLIEGLHDPFLKDIIIMTGRYGYEISDIRYKIVTQSDREIFLDFIGKVGLNSTTISTFIEHQDKLRIPKVMSNYLRVNEVLELESLRYSIPEEQRKAFIGELENDAFVGELIKISEYGGENTLTILGSLYDIFFVNGFENFVFEGKNKDLFNQAAEMLEISGESDFTFYFYRIKKDFGEIGYTGAVKSYWDNISGAVTLESGAKRTTIRDIAYSSKTFFEYHPEGLSDIQKIALEILPTLKSSQQIVLLSCLDIFEEDLKDETKRAILVEYIQTSTFDEISQREFKIIYPLIREDILVTDVAKINETKAGEILQISKYSRYRILDGYEELYNNDNKRSVLLLLINMKCSLNLFYLFTDHYDDIVGDDISGENIHQNTAYFQDINSIFNGLYNGSFRDEGNIIQILKESLNPSVRKFYVQLLGSSIALGNESPYETKSSLLKVKGLFSNERQKKKVISEIKELVERFNSDSIADYRFRDELEGLLKKQGFYDTKLIDHIVYDYSVRQDGARSRYAKIDIDKIDFSKIDYDYFSGEKNPEPYIYDRDVQGFLLKLSDVLGGYNVGNFLDNNKSVNTSIGDKNTRNQLLDMAKELKQVLSMIEKRFGLIGKYEDVWKLAEHADVTGLIDSLNKLPDREFKLFFTLSKKYYDQGENIQNLLTQGYLSTYAYIHYELEHKTYRFIDFHEIKQIQETGTIETLKLLKSHFPFEYNTRNYKGYITIHNLPQIEKGRFIETVSKAIKELGYKFEPTYIEEVMSLVDTEVYRNTKMIHDETGINYTPSDAEDIKGLGSLDEQTRNKIYTTVRILKDKYYYDFKLVDYQKLLDFHNFGLIEVSDQLVENFDHRFRLSNIDRYKVISNKPGIIDTMVALGQIDTFKREFSNGICRKECLYIHESNTQELILDLSKMISYSPDKLRFDRDIQYDLLSDPRYVSLLEHYRDAGEEKHMTIGLINHLHGLDYPTYYSKLSMDNFEYFADESKTKDEEGNVVFVPHIETFFQFFATDYTSTDFKILGIDMEKDFPRDESPLSKITEVIGGLEKGVNLRTFDINRIDKYEQLFNFLRKSNLSKWESQILGSMDFSSFRNYANGVSLTELVGSITLARNKIHPDIDTYLLEQIPDVNDKIIAGLAQAYRPQERKIDVTQNNIEDINAILEYCKLLKTKGPIVAILQKFFPNYEVGDEFEQNFAYLISKLDVEEIDFRRIDDLSDLKNILSLQKKMREYGEKASNKYLQNKFGDIDIMSIFTSGKLSESGTTLAFCCDTKTIEEMRQYFNYNVDRILGDEFVTSLGGNFIKSTPASYENLPLLLKFATNWKNADVSRDIKGIYQLGSNFAYNSIIKFIYKELGDGHTNTQEVEKELRKHGLSLSSLEEHFNNNGVPFNILKGNLQKGVTRLLSGNTTYVANKLKSKLAPGASIETVLSSSIEVKEVLWSSFEGVEVKKVLIQGKEMAKIIKVSPDVGKTTLLMDRDGMVNMGSEEKEKKGRLIFSAPIAFSTGNHKMTEIAVKNGEFMNHLLSPYGKDGFVITDREGNVSILNKTKLQLSDFLHNELSEESSRYKTYYDQEGILIDRSFAPLSDYDDFILFDSIVKQKRLSLLSNMLLIENGEMAPYGSDNNDSRRFFVEYNDGTFGIIDSSQNMPTKQLMEISIAVGIKNAVYMDTGMYDMATYYEPDSTKHVMGHRDTDSSTNRLVIYVD